jgi:beta-N-acetylhexosaminidase
MELNCPRSSDEIADEDGQATADQAPVIAACQSVNVELSAPDVQEIANPSPLSENPSATSKQKRHDAVSASPFSWMPRWRSLSSVLLLCIVLIHALSLGALQFVGPQGWAYVLGGPQSSTNANLLTNINHRLLHSAARKNAPAATETSITPLQYINLIIRGMTLDQKLGQMMIVQFLGSTYSLPLSTMLSQENVGAVIIYSTNGNIVSGGQLKHLVLQMQSASRPIPPGIATDQEGGYVNRLQRLIGPRPSAASIGATNDAAKARTEGLQDAGFLSSYGINMNLAPVVDVDNTYSSELHLDLRTFGRDPSTVTKMAGAYLQGLQQSGKVIGVLKHFPGLGDVTVDPHEAIPHLMRSKTELERIDWAPYRSLIQRGAVHALMVTHVIVDAVDPTKPASLSADVMQHVLRNELGFQGVVITDSLMMTGITASYTPGQAAALSIEAGADMVMGASSPHDVATMVVSIKQAMASGAISQQRIDESVRRILLMKYQMGLISIPRS